MQIIEKYSFSYYLCLSRTFSINTKSLVVSILVAHRIFVEIQLQFDILCWHTHTHIAQRVDGSERLVSQREGKYTAQQLTTDWSFAYFLIIDICMYFDRVFGFCSVCIYIVGFKFIYIYRLFNGCCFHNLHFIEINNFYNYYYMYIYQINISMVPYIYLCLFVCLFGCQWLYRDLSGLGHDLRNQ